MKKRTANYNIILKIDSHRPSPSSVRNNSSSISTHSFQTLPEYTAYLNSDTDLLDSLPSNPNPSAPYSPERITATPNNTPILQTQTTTTTTESQNLPFLESNSPVSDSCDEAPNEQDTSSIINRPPFHLFLLPALFISLILIQFFNTLVPVHTEYQPQQKQLEKLLYQHYQRILLYHQQVKLQLKL